MQYNLMFVFKKYDRQNYVFVFVQVTFLRDSEHSNYG